MSGSASVRKRMAVLDAFRLDGRTVVTTGASSGLGVAFAVAAAEAGANLVLGARRTEMLDETQALVEKAGGRAVALRTDVSQPGDCAALINEGMKAFGRVDVLINNAGIATAIPAIRETPQQFEEVIAVNLLGCYWMAQASARVMKPGSSIVNISSVLGITTAGLPQAAYSAAKAGLLGLTRDLAQQWTGRKGIRVNAILPGFFRSEMTGRYRPGYIEEQLPRVLAGRMGDPQELAAAVIFLTSDAGGYVTGQTLVVDGGFSIA